MQKVILGSKKLIRNFCVTERSSFFFLENLRSGRLIWGLEVGVASKEVPLASYPTLHNPPNQLSNGRPVLRFGLVARRGTQNKGPVIRARGGWRIIWGFIVGDARQRVGRMERERKFRCGAGLNTTHLAREVWSTTNRSVASTRTVIFLFYW